MSNRIGRWTYFHHPYNGPVWRLDGTYYSLEHDPDCHSVCAGGKCNGGWVLYGNGRYAAPVSEYLRDAMRWTEQKYDAAVRAIAMTFAVAALVSQRSRQAGRSNEAEGIT